MPHTAATAPGPEERLVDALVRTSFDVIAVLSRVAAEHQLSLTQLRVLAILRDRTVKMGELAAYLGLDRSTVSGLVERAERRGLVHRSPHPTDKRGIDVALTPSGAALARRGAAMVAAELAPMTTALTRAEAVRLSTLLEQLLVPG